MAVGAAGAGARGAAAVAGGASTAYSMGSAAAGGGASGVAAGLSSVGKAGVSAATNPLRRSMSESYRSGSRAAFEATGGKFSNSPDVSPSASGVPPAWARRMKQQQTLHHGAAVAAHAVRSGDHGGGGTAVSLSEKS